MVVEVPKWTNAKMEVRDLINIVSNVFVFKLITLY